MADEEEVWKIYSEFPFIEASNLGRIRTKDRYVTVKGQGKRFVKGHILKQRLRPDGYMDVGFGVGGKVVHLRVHRIVATCFIPNPENFPEVNHIDCDPTNNTVSNLEWCTNQYNVEYRDKLGHTAKKNAPKKPVIVVNQKTSEALWFESQCEAGRQLDICVQGINNVVKGKRNQTHDYWFCNADENAVENVRTKFGDEVANKVEKLMRES